MRSRKWRNILVIIALVMAFCFFYVKTHPLIFNESWAGHRHCISQLGKVFSMYSMDHDGHFPSHTNGYGDALLLIADYLGRNPQFLTGPCYDDSVFEHALSHDENVNIPEEECGRVYVQGLSPKSNSEIVILYDKVATPGGDHCHLPQRFRASLGREVLYIDGSTGYVKESEWPDFTKKQIALLIEEGFQDETARWYYSQEPKEIKQGFRALFQWR